jgi:hypothetical protein
MFCQGQIENPCEAIDIHNLPQNLLTWIDISYGPYIANSPFGSALWPWMLPSNNSSPYGRLENPATIVNLLDFPICPLMNLISNEAFS